MKLFFPVLCLALFAACDSQEDRPAPAPAPKTFKAANATRFNDWTAYYDTNDPVFGKGAFVLHEERPLDTMPGSIVGNFSPDFDAIYRDLLIYSPDGKRYIDIDSYKWSVGEEGEIASSPDQEIDLVDTDSKTVTRIAFRGPSQWVEDAFWKNGQTVCLLENSSEKVLSVTEIDLGEHTVKTYVYSDTLTKDSQYTSLRISDAVGKQLSGL